MSQNRHKFVNWPIANNLEEGDIIIYDSSTEVFIGRSFDHEIDDHIDIPIKPTSGSKLLEINDGIISWENHPEQKSYITFGLKSDVNLSDDYLETSGGSTIGYAMPTDGHINSMGIVIDSTSACEIKLVKNGLDISSTILTNQKSVVNTNVNVDYIKGDILRSRYIRNILGTTDVNNPYTPDSNTLFLAHFDEDVADSRHITNSSTICKGMSGRLRNGADFSTTKKFGSYSVNFDGYNDYMEILHHKDYDVQNATVEFFFRPDDTMYTQALFSKDALGYGGHLYIGLEGDDIYVRSQGTGTTKTIQFDPNIYANTWYHIAVVLGTGGIKVFLNGYLWRSDGSWTQGLNGNVEPIVVGAGNTSNSSVYYGTIDNYFNGRIDELRISKTRRYETNFSAPSSAFTTDSNTLGLWHFDEGSGNLAYDFSDIIHNAMMMTSGSLPEIKTDYVKFGTHSLRSNYSKDDWVRFNHNPYYESSTITVECWIRPFCEEAVIFQKGDDGSTEGALQIFWQLTDKNIRVTYYGASTSRTMYTANNTFPDYEWHHIAVTIDTDYIRLFVDGEECDNEVLTSDFQNVWNNNRDDVYISSAENRTYFFESYYDEIRISNVVRTYGTIWPDIKKVTLIMGID